MLICFASCKPQLSLERVEAFHIDSVVATSQTIIWRTSWWKTRFTWNCFHCNQWSSHECSNSVVLHNATSTDNFINGPTSGIRRWIPSRSLRNIYRHHTRRKTWHFPWWFPLWTVTIYPRASIVLISLIYIGLEKKRRIVNHYEPGGATVILFSRHISQISEKSCPRPWPRGRSVMSIFAGRNGDKLPQTIPMLVIPML